METQPSAQFPFQKLNQTIAAKKQAKLDITLLKPCPALLHSLSLCQIHWLGLQLQLLTPKLSGTRFAGPNTFKQQYLKNDKSKQSVYRCLLKAMFFREYSIRPSMICRLIDFAVVILQLLMFEVCENIGILKIGFFIFSSNERAKSLYYHYTVCIIDCKCIAFAFLGFPKEKKYRNGQELWLKVK